MLSKTHYLILITWYLLRNTSFHSSQLPLISLFIIPNNSTSGCVTGISKSQWLFQPFFSRENRDKIYPAILGTVSTSIQHLLNVQWILSSHEQGSGLQAIVDCIQSRSQQQDDSQLTNILSRDSMENPKPSPWILFVVAVCVHINRKGHAYLPFDHNLDVQLLSLPQYMISRTKHSLRPLASSVSNNEAISIDC